MKTPIIVLTPQNMPMEEPFKKPYNYSNGYNTSAILKWGGMPVIPTFLNEEQALELMERADGLLMTGGADVDPSLYGEEKMDCCGTIEYDRDKSDLALLKAALALKKPVLCICRGCQIASVYFGSTMYQDIPTQAPSELKHSNYTFPDVEEETTHNIKVVEGSPLHKLVGELEFGVNSLHHQAADTVGKDMIVGAVSEDGIIESIEHATHPFCMGVQWHPEKIWDIEETSGKIFEAFIEACRK